MVHMLTSHASGVSSGESSDECILLAGLLSVMLSTLRRSEMEARPTKNQ